MNPGLIVIPAPTIFAIQHCACPGVFSALTMSISANQSPGHAPYVSWAVFCTCRVRLCHHNSQDTHYACPGLFLTQLGHTCCVPWPYFRQPAASTVEITQDTQVSVLVLFSIPAAVVSALWKPRTHVMHVLGGSLALQPCLRRLQAQGTCCMCPGLFSAPATSVSTHQLSPGPISTVQQPGTYDICVVALYFQNIQRSYQPFL